MHVQSTKTNFSQLTCLWGAGTRPTNRFLPTDVSVGATPRADRHAGGLVQAGFFRTQPPRGLELKTLRTPKILSRPGPTAPDGSCPTSVSLGACGGWAAKLRIVLGIPIGYDDVPLKLMDAATEFGAVRFPRRVRRSRSMSTRSMSAAGHSRVGRLDVAEVLEHSHGIC